MIAGSFPVSVTVWAGRSSLVVACLHGAAWLRFLTEWDRRALSGVERAVTWAALGAAALGLVPGLAVGAR